jgi:hypothetical protein
MCLQGIVAGLSKVRRADRAIVDPKKLASLLFVQVLTAVVVAE